MPKPDQSDLLYGSKSPAEKMGVNWHFQANMSLTDHGMIVSVTATVRTIFQLQLIFDCTFINFLLLCFEKIEQRDVKSCRYVYIYS